MLEIRTGVYVGNFPQPLPKALQTAARLGARAVELRASGELAPGKLTRTGVRHLRKMLDDLGLTIAAIRFQTRGGYNDLDQLERRLEATKQVMSTAFELGCSTVVNQVGRIPESAEGDSWNLLLTTLADLGRHGQRVGSFLAHRTGPESPELLSQLLDAIPAGSLMVDFDPGRLILNGFSASTAIEQLSDHIVHVHACDAVRDLAMGRGIETVLGRGSVDFAEIFARLEERRYGGWFTVEREESAQQFQELADSIGWLKSFG